MKLSVLICTIPGREIKLSVLTTGLAAQIDLLGARDEVEVLWLGDLKQRSIGAKRNVLVAAARGEYSVFVDDDDRVNSNYVAEILKALHANPGVTTVVFKTITHRADLGTHKVNLVGRHQPRTETTDLVTCPTTHTMVWRTEVMRGVPFPDMDQGEDVAWVDRALPCIESEVAIDKVLYHYDYDPNVSERR